MRFLQLLVQLSMRRKCDWQSAFYVRTPDRFSWNRVLRKLTCSRVQGIAEKRHEALCVKHVLAAMRWGRPRFLIQWTNGSIPETFPTLLKTFLDSWTGDWTASEYQHLRAYRVLCKEAKATPNRHYVVDIGLSFTSGSVSPALLTEIMQVLENHGEKASQRRSLYHEHGGVSLELRVTTLRFAGECTMTRGALEQLGQLVRDSKYLKIQEIMLQRREDNDSVSLQRCLADLTVPAPASAAAGTASPRESSFRGLKRLVFHQDLNQLAVLGSMARYETSIRELDTVYGEGPLNWLAAWLAFGFFHCDSASRVDTVRLRVSQQSYRGGYSSFDHKMDDWCVGTFKRALSRVVPHGLAPLEENTRTNAKRKQKQKDASESPLDELPLSETERTMVEVQAKTKARRQPTPRSPVIAVLGVGGGMEGRITQFQVIRRLRDWLAVVVPGFGAGWITKESVVNEFTLPTKVPVGSSEESPSTNQRIKSFTWVNSFTPYTTNDRNADALTKLVSVFGGQLKVVQLTRNGLSNRHLVQIIKHCPNLKELNLFGNQITDIKPLVDSYEQGKCKISILNIEHHGDNHVLVAEQATRILQICSEKGSSTAPQPPSIEQLAIRLYPLTPGSDQLTENRVLPAFAEALKVSPSLEYAQLVTPPFHHTNQRLIATMDDTAVESSFLPTRRPTRPLLLGCKLAVVSVVHHDSYQQSALSLFDAGILTLVFSLLPCSHSRVVDVSSHFLDSSVDAVATSDLVVDAARRPM